MIKDYIRLLRPYQYLKNLLIFFPLFFSLKISNIDLLINAFIAFIAFCFASSSVYIFNDYFDVNEDRKHPLKKYRPLASLSLSKSIVIALMIVLIFISLTISFLLKNSIFLLISLYFGLNIFYTIKLKHIAIIDIITIAIFFVIRLIVGTEAIHGSASMWIILDTFLLAVFLALSKRRDDFIIYLNSGNKPRKVINGYNIEFFDTAMMIMASVTVVSYIMYTISAEVINRFETDKLYLTVLWVIIGILRYMQMTFVYEKSGSPTILLIKDKFLQLILLGWIVSFGILIYLW
jgi:decaprenyl-phosphate phosphoribosyltransferase